MPHYNSLKSVVLLVEISLITQIERNKLPRSVGNEDPGSMQVLKTDSQSVVERVMRFSEGFTAPRSLRADIKTTGLIRPLPYRPSADLRFDPKPRDSNKVKSKFRHKILEPTIPSVC